MVGVGGCDVLPQRCLEIEESRGSPWRSHGGVITDDIPDRQAKDYRSLVSVRDGADFARGTVDETERDETGRFRAEERRKRPPRSESTRA
ncbi:hypothetical protein V1477_016872 [Vespula maculifrons]|uniref:Uncharacterized protein n=1 Tax=Vespula maculifrons TaxID=7453 RepID=A0ABD2B4J2_VESMC